MAIPSYLHGNAAIRWIVTRRMQTVLDQLRFGEGQRILDFGCGTGMLLLQLPPRGATLVGVDVELAPARAFLHAHDRSSVALLDSRDWFDHVADHSLDRIVALEVLEHVDDLQDTICQFARKLTPDGRLIVSGPTENYLYSVARWIAGFSGEYHKRDIYEIQQAVEAAGFQCVTRRSLPLPRPLALFIVTSYTRSLARGAETFTSM
jgi:2-polyprenyl-3-methyl-5-hydroxy-6-metoxy-1,4-benzoquinol methylase